MHDANESAGRGDSSKADHCYLNVIDSASEMTEPLAETMDEHGERYLPSPADIARECAAIRAEWDTRQIKDRGPDGYVPWRVPGIDRNSEILHRED